jgi:hypothetical protein
MTQYAAIAALLSLSAAMTAASSDFANEPAKVNLKHFENVLKITRLTTSQIP